jgi:chromate reductase, NAD(P)H dehydrogenase (quinone)
VNARSVQVLAISGSLRRRSTNTELLRAAVELAPPGMAIGLYEGLDRLPHFNPDLESMLPDAVIDLKRRFQRADGVLISSPEYARGVPGSLKNALDWLVSGPEFVDKPVALLSASSRSTHAYDALRTTLETMSGRFVAAASITLPLLGRNLDAAGIASDPDVAPALRRALDAFFSAIANGFE